MCGLTFELSRRQRQDARPGLAVRGTSSPARAWRPAVGAPLERAGRAHSRRAHADPEIGCESHAMNWRMQPHTESNCRSSMRPTMFRMTVPMTFCTPDKPSAADCCTTKFAFVAFSDCRKY